MKIILIIILLVLLGTQVMTVYSSNRTEQQPYKVLFQEGEFEIREYPPALLASVTDADTSLRGSANSNFRKLAGYIFGKNQTEKKISMTAPVHMEKTENGSTMSFVMPSDLRMQDLPDPLDSDIAFRETSREVVAAVRFSGFASDQDIREQSDKLRNWLANKNVETNSAYRYLGYNPPYQLTGRRNEIIVGVTWNPSPITQ